MTSPTPTNYLECFYQQSHSMAAFSAGLLPSDTEKKNNKSSDLLLHYLLNETGEKTEHLCEYFSLW